jgi:hypothetical protein
VLGVIALLLGSDVGAMLPFVAAMLCGSNTQAWLLVPRTALQMLCCSGMVGQVTALKSTQGGLGFGEAVLAAPLLTV